MEYNEYTIEQIKKLVEKGQELAKEYENEETMIRNTNFNFSQYRFVSIGFKNPEYVVGDVETFYRIGEPRVDGGCYKPSWNYAKDMAEDGVSVVTTAWLNSFKSIFFNTTDEKIAARGVYKIVGIKLPSNGGDDETLIIPLDWAEKTKIRTRSGLEKAVRKH